MNPFDFDIETMNNNYTKNKNYTDSWLSGLKCHICGFWMRYGQIHVCSCLPFGIGVKEKLKEEEKLKEKLKEDLLEIHQLLSSAAFNMTEELEINETTDFIYKQINRAIIKIVEIQNELEKEIEWKN